MLALGKRQTILLFSPLSKLTDFNIKNENTKVDISIANSGSEIVFQGSENISK